MSIPGAGSPLFLSAAAAAAAAGYQIDRSIRINDDDTGFLNRTPSSASNRKTWTWSAWVKRGKISEEANLFSVGASSTDAAFRFNTDDTLQVRDGGGGEDKLAKCHLAPSSRGLFFSLACRALLRQTSAAAHQLTTPCRPGGSRPRALSRQQQEAGRRPSCFDVLECCAGGIAQRDTALRPASKP